MTEIALIDYGKGNLLSVSRAFETCGAKVRIVSSGKEVLSASKLVLPGVGAFGSAMDELRLRGLVDPIRECVRSGKPMLGICLGMQLLMERSHEFGVHEGLGIIKGEVREIERTTPDGRQRKIPHIGWNSLQPPNKASAASWSRGLFASLEPGSYVYFVHSFMSVPDDREALLGVTNYDGGEITAAINVGAVWGCQFHPEKSGPAGLRIVQNFISL